MAEDIYVGNQGDDDLQVDCGAVHHQVDTTGGAAAASTLTRHLYVDDDDIHDEDLYDPAPFKLVDIRGSEFGAECSSMTSDYSSHVESISSFNRSPAPYHYNSAPFLPSCNSALGRGGSGGVEVLHDHTYHLDICAGRMREMRLNSIESSSDKDSDYFSHPGRISSEFSTPAKLEWDKNSARNSGHPVSPGEEEVAWMPGSSAFIDADGDSPLHIAVSQRRENIVTDMLTGNDSTDYVDLKDAQGRTALHLAVLTDQPELVQPLLQSGADPFSRDHSGETPLHNACQQGLLCCVKTLVALVSVLYPSVLHNNANIRNYAGYTCLHLAADNGHTKVMTFLLRHMPIDINAGDGCSGRTVLHHAADRGDKLMVFFLLKNFPERLNLNALAHDRRTTALTLARGREYSDIVEILESGGANKYYIEGATFETSDSDSETDMMF